MTTVKTAQQPARQPARQPAHSEEAQRPKNPALRASKVWHAQAEGAGMSEQNRARLPLTGRSSVKGEEAVRAGATGGLPTSANQCHRLVDSVCTVRHREGEALAEPRRSEPRASKRPIRARSASEG
jgi:hypothetical protein